MAPLALAQAPLAQVPPPPAELQEPGPSAISANVLKSVVQQSVLNNPEVLFRWHAFLAADREHDASIAGYLPKLDLTAAKGKEQRDDPTQRSSTTILRDYTRTSSSLTLTQMIYDGFLTRNEVKRLNHARMTRLFELQDATESTALESVRAYLDVQRYRELVRLAEDNYVRHRSVFEQIQLKVKAGVGRRVDLEQASGRLALAESNLLVDTSNLHDVSARFQRLTGASPAKDLEPVSGLEKGLPRNSRDAQATAQLSNPALRASVENVRSADAAHSGRYAPFQPRFDLRFRNDRGQDLNGVVGATDNKIAEVVMTWNIFNGFADVSRVRQFAEQRNVARDLRDKACRDMRQTLAIAYNDTRKLTEQLGYLDQHQLSIEKARDAYRKQFDIGQRTLLDVLDTENELFQARRAYTNAEFDLQLSFARAHAGMGKLFEVLGLTRLDDEEKKLSEKWASEGDGAEQCPPEGPALYVADKSQLNERASELLRELAPKSAAAADAAAIPGQPGAPIATITPATPLVTSPTPAPEAETPVHSIGLALKAWVAVWSGKNVSGYLDSYAKSFIPADGSDLPTWQAKRRAALERPSEIKLDISDVKIEMRDLTHAVSTFVQDYRTPTYKDTVAKTLEWEKIDGRWLIVGEASKPFQAAAVVKRVKVAEPAAAASAATAVVPAAPVPTAAVAKP